MVETQFLLPYFLRPQGTSLSSVISYALLLSLLAYVLQLVLVLVPNWPRTLISSRQTNKKVCLVLNSTSPVVLTWLLETPVRLLNILMLSQLFLDQSNRISFLCIYVWLSAFAAVHGLSLVVAIRGCSVAVVLWLLSQWLLLLQTTRIRAEWAQYLWQADLVVQQHGLFCEPGMEPVSLHELANS